MFTVIALVAIIADYLINTRLSPREKKPTSIAKVSIKKRTPRQAPTAEESRDGWPS